MPTQGSGNVRCVDGVTAIVSWPVLDERDQVLVVATGARKQIVEMTANGPDYIDIGPFVRAADVVDVRGRGGVWWAEGKAGRRAALAGLPFPDTRPPRFPFIVTRGTRDRL